MPRADGYLSLAFCYGVHGVERIEQEIEHDLLQLDPVPAHRVDIALEVEHDLNSSDHRIAMEKPDHILNQAVEIKLLESQALLLDQGSQLANDFAGAFGVLGNIQKHFPNFIEKRGWFGQEPR